jgi:hypothetical protein
VRGKHGEKNQTLRRSMRVSSDASEIKEKKSTHPEKQNTRAYGDPPSIFSLVVYRPGNCSNSEGFSPNANHCDLERRNCICMSCQTGHHKSSLASMFPSKLEPGFPEPLSAPDRAHISDFPLRLLSRLRLPKPNHWGTQICSN